MSDELVWLAVVGLPSLVLLFHWFRTRPVAEGGEVFPTQDPGAVRVKLSDGWQEFQVFCTCPKCGLYALHHMEEPNPEPPKVEDWNDVIVSWGGQTIREIPPRQDRPDEREWSVARECRCGKRWGQR